MATSVPDGGDPNEVSPCLSSGLAVSFPSPNCPQQLQSSCACGGPALGDLGSPVSGPKGVPALLQLGLQIGHTRRLLEELFFTYLHLPCFDF